MVDEEVASKEYIPTSDEVLKLVGSKVIKEFAPFGIFKGNVVSYEVFNMCVVCILPYHFYLSFKFPSVFMHPLFDIFYIILPIITTTILLGTLF
jgi:hypothetical protein